MGSRIVRRFAGSLVFFIGLFLMVMGITFLFSSSERASRISVFLAFFLVVSGVFFAVLAVKINKRSYYLFFASFFMMTGIYLFLSALGIIPLPFSRAWPLLSVFSGLALLPVGWRRTGGFSARYFVPSLFFVTLGCVLLIFSMDVVSFSFRQFIIGWWPLLFLLGGITLILISLSVNNFRSPGGKTDDNNSPERME